MRNHNRIICLQSALHLATCQVYVVIFQPLNNWTFRATACAYALVLKHRGLDNEKYMAIHAKKQALSNLALG